MDKEIWKDVPGYEGLYQVSSKGRVRSMDRIVSYKETTQFKKGKILLPMIAGANYLYVNLWKNNKRKYVSVHRLVALAFIPNPKGLKQVNHKDEDKTNNNVSNLEWCDAKYNINYGNTRKKISEGLIRNNGFSVPIIQKDKNGCQLSTYASAAEAERLTGICASSIRKVCKKKPKFKTAGGFYWEEITPVRNHNN